VKRVNEELSKFSSWKSNLTPTIYNSRQAPPLLNLFGSVTFLIWIQIRGSIPLEHDPDSDPAVFFGDFHDANKKYRKFLVFPRVFCLLLTEGEL
jgi:hypothetical protein